MSLLAVTKMKGITLWQSSNKKNEVCSCAPILPLHRLGFLIPLCSFSFLFSVPLSPFEFFWQWSDLVDSFSLSKLESRIAELEWPKYKLKD